MPTHQDRIDMKRQGDSTTIESRPETYNWQGTRQALMIAVLEILKSTDSVSDLNVKSICAQANVSRATFYRNWTDAQDCLVSALDFAVAPIILDFTDKAMPAPECLADLTLAMEKIMFRPEIRKCVGMVMIGDGRSAVVIHKIRKDFEERRNICEKLLQKYARKVGKSFDINVVLDIINGLALNAVVTGRKLSRSDLVNMFIVMTASR